MKKMTNQKRQKKWAAHNEKMKSETIKSKTTNRQLQLPVKFGSSGFRWASFRLVPIAIGIFGLTGIEDQC
jgi:hypothetical protein